MSSDEDEKVKLHREIERQKALLRVEETFPDADACPACLAARQKTGTELRFEAGQTRAAVVSCTLRDLNAGH